MSFKPLRACAFILSAAMALFIPACGGGDDDDPAPIPQLLQTFDVQLTPDQEVGNVLSGAFGAATLTLDRARGVLSGTANVNGLTPTVAHVHTGAAGVSGPILFDMTVSPTGATLPATTLTPAQLAALDAGQLYVNVHTAANPGGEIRGQIGREVYVATLTGAQETPPVATAATGSGLVELNPATRALTGTMQVTGLAATAAHIHVAAVGVPGGIAIHLQDQGNGRFTVPANTVMTEAQVASLRAGDLYFNAHSALFANGEVRGQIGRRVLFAAASGAQEVSPTPSLATGVGTVVYNPATRAISGSLRITGMTATAAHIHAGVAGVNGGILVPLAETPAGSGVWAVPANTVLTADQARALLTGGLYYNAHSTAFPDGEIRGQISLQ